MKILAIDYGLKRIGLAVSDENQIIALPLTTIDAGKNLDDSVQNILNEIEVRKLDLEKILIGYPLQMNGQEGEMAKISKNLLEKLKEKLSIPLLLYDERLTSKMAEKALIEMKIKRKKRKIDPLAATLLLQTYLDGSL